jgi:hypothetical protein
MKNHGENFIPSFCIALGVAAVFLAFRNSSYKKISKLDKVDRVQYGNMLIEFFERDSIEYVYEKYKEYVDMGISPKNAFSMLVEEK